MKKLILLIVFLLTALESFSQDITGDWYGTLQIMGTPLPLIFHIKGDSTGYTATMDSPDQQARDIQIREISFNNDSVVLKMPQLMASYQGYFRLKPQEIHGTFTQNGTDLKLNLTRTPQEKPNRPQEPQKPYPYHSENLHFYNKKQGDTLAATLTLPRKGNNFPGLILISGSGPQNRDEEILGHKPFLVIADYLTRHGIAVLRYDDRGTGESTGSFEGSTTADFATDTEAAFHYLETRHEINSDQIGLMGHSEGGEIAPMVAAKNKAIAFMILLAAPGVNGAEILLKQQKLIGKAEGKSDEFLKNNATINKKAYALINTIDDSLELRKKLKMHFRKAIKKHPDWNTLKAKGVSDDHYVDKVLATYMGAWMRYFITHDPSTVLQNINCPVLALNGTNDLQIKADQNLPAIKKALKKGSNPQVTLKKLNGLNHLFQESKTGLPAEYREIEQTFSPKALRLIKNWILAKTNSKD